MGMKKQAVILAVILAVLLALHTGFAAQGTGIMNTVTTGTGIISSGDLPGARQAAVSDALALAVVNAFARVVSPQVFAANLEFLHTRILPSAQDYLVTYRVLGETAQKNQCLVGVESRINLELMEQTLIDAKIIDVDNDKPAVLFLIAEQTPGDLLPRYWWRNNPVPYVSHAEATLLAIMMENRFKITGEGPNRPDPGFYDIRFSTIYDADAAMDLAEKLNSDLVVMGRAGASESINRMGDEQIFDADVTLTVYEPASGRPVLTCEKNATAKSGPDQQGDIQAIAQAAELAGAELAEKLDSFWTRQLRRETPFDVRIEGEGFLPRFLVLKKRFAQMRGIQNFQPREIGSDHAVMEMIYKGSPDHFADSIMLRNFEGFGIEIVEVTDHLVTIRFIDEGRPADRTRDRSLGIAPGFS